MKMVNIITMNVNGLRNANKRKEVFLYLKKNKVDIAMIQESHSDTSYEGIWKNEWGGNIIFNHGESNAKEVAILCKPNLEIQIHKIHNDSCGRLLMLECTLCDQQIAITNVYAPNEDKPEFFIKLLLKC